MGLAARRGRKHAESLSLSICGLEAKTLLMRRDVSSVPLNIHATVVLPCAAARWRRAWAARPLPPAKGPARVWEPWVWEAPT